MLGKGQNITYIAQQSGDRVTIIASGRQLKGYQILFVDAPHAAFPPEYKIRQQRNKELAVGGMTNFMSHVSFPTADRLERVVVHDREGRHEIEVLQITSEENISQLFVNGTTFKVAGVTTNSLTDEACNRSGIDGVDMHTSVSNLREVSLSIIEPDTCGLIYFVPGTVQLDAPLSAATCVRLKDRMGGKTSIDVFVCDMWKYTKQPIEFSLDGELGCTAVANLGFCLLKSLHDITPRSLSTITVSDEAWIDRYEDADLKVADDPILAYCRSLGFEKLGGTGPKNDNDCERWSACKGMKGKTCKHTRPKCK